MSPGLPPAREVQGPGGTEAAASPSSCDSLRHAHTEQAGSCPVCRFVIEAVERDLFWTFAERISLPEFHEKMATDGGWCACHLRHVLRRHDGDVPTLVYRVVVSGYLARIEVPSPASSGGRGTGGPRRGNVSNRTAGGGCPSCEAATRAEAHAIWVLAGGTERRDVAARVDPTGVLCLPHVRSLAAALYWKPVESIRARIDAALSAATTDERILRTTALAGPDPDRTLRDSEHGRTGVTPSSSATSWMAGVLSADGLAVELQSLRCPVCSAATVAATTLLRWLDGEARTSNDLRDLEHLCAAHVWDATWNTPHAADLVGSRAIERWRHRLSSLAGPLDTRTRSWPNRLFAPRRQSDVVDPSSGQAEPSSAKRWSANAAARAAGLPPPTPRDVLRADECLACRASVTAVDRALSLLAAFVLDAEGRRIYLRSDGLCLRHAAVTTHFPAASREVVRERIRARVALADWELAEAFRKASWSVRYEPRGRETGAWRRTAVLAAGTCSLETSWLAPEPNAPVDAV